MGLFSRSKDRREIARLKAELVEASMTIAAVRKANAATTNQWNALVQRINAKGGEQFLRGESTQFTREELTHLIKLCHPDKHGGSASSVAMTQKLLNLRG